VITGWQRRSNMVGLVVQKLRARGGRSPPEWVLPGRIGCWTYSAPEKPQVTGRGVGVWRVVCRSPDLA
jgi:hypothetical protein